MCAGCLQETSLSVSTNTRPYSRDIYPVRQTACSLPWSKLLFSRSHALHMPMQCYDGPAHAFAGAFAGRPFCSGGGAAPVVGLHSHAQHRSVLQHIHRLSAEARAGSSTRRVYLQHRVAGLMADTHGVCSGSNMLRTPAGNHCPHMPCTPQFLRHLMVHSNSIVTGGGLTGRHRP